jgi:hypothetical protein
MAQTTIAIVCDCDDTLAPDTTAQILTACGIDVYDFYVNRVSVLVDKGYDPAVAYLYELKKVLPNLTRERIQEIGSHLKIFPGIPQLFLDIEKEIREEFREEGICVREFIISGGIKDLIISSPLGTVVDHMWGCNFDYNKKGKILCIKNVVSFTEKTRFLFNIQKGLYSNDYDNQPYAVNMWIEPDERPIPFKNMIYLGDGPSDIPCMSIIEAQGSPTGKAIGILHEKDPLRTWALSHGRRASPTVPPDFTKEGKYAFNIIREAVRQIAERIRRDIGIEHDLPYSKY